MHACPAVCRATPYPRGVPEGLPQPLCASVFLTRPCTVCLLPVAFCCCGLKTKTKTRVPAPVVLLCGTCSRSSASLCGLGIPLRGHCSQVPPRGGSSPNSSAPNSEAVWHLWALPLGVIRPAVAQGTGSLRPVGSWPGIGGCDTGAQLSARGRPAQEGELSMGRCSHLPLLRFGQSLG